MISVVKGAIFNVSPGIVEVDSANGLIFKVLVPVSSYTQMRDKEQIELFTVLRIKEDQMVLYGFSDRKERVLFEKLIAISGVGGKTALSFISAFSTDELVEAVNNGDTVKISSIPGIGKKTAQRIILELTGKLELEDNQVNERVQLKEDLISGLVNLGYPVKSVTTLVSNAIKEHPEIDSFEEWFKLLLKKISKL
jgi:Holliday junction DNA helicase RuvA